mgnify:CR=1 FL=1
MVAEPKDVTFTSFETKKYNNKYDDFYSFGNSIIKEAPVGSVISVSTDLGNHLYFEHNPCGNISKITDDKGNFIQILYYPTGHVKSFLKNGKVFQTKGT